MLPINKERLAAENLALWNRSGRHVFEVSLANFAENNPTEPCAFCFGRGSFVTNAKGERRPFDAKIAEGDVYCGSCPKCRGFGKKFVSKARALYLMRRALREQRKEYRRIREAVLAERSDYTAAEFDRLAKKKLGAAEPTPASWVAAARAVAAFFEVEIPRPRAA